MAASPKVKAARGQSPGRAVAAQPKSKSASTAHTQHDFEFGGPIGGDLLCVRAFRGRLITERNDEARKGPECGDGGARHAHTCAEVPLNAGTAVTTVALPFVILFLYYACPNKVQCGACGRESAGASASPL
jgi:hypothetical protein